MKIQNKFMVVIAAIFAISDVSGKLTAKADVSGNTIAKTMDKMEEPAETEPEISDEMPAFEARLEYSPQGWIVKGTFQNFTSDTILVRPMCSTDGEIYYDCGQEWSLRWLGSGEESELAELRNQRCLFGSEEPLKSYLAKDLNRFYIKLRIVREGGIVYETQAAVIEREELKPLPMEFDVAARFAPGVFVREGRPPNIQYYGRYQITVSENASNDEIFALLPDTLPVEVQIQEGGEYAGSDIVECRVQWKPLELSRLTAGERVTVTDAAEKIVIPADTVLNIQTGTYRINEPLDMEQNGITDEVRLVLNVVAKDGRPAGVLAEENHGLEMAFNLKPTGAVSIRAYTFTEGASEWTEISELSLEDAVNAQPSTENSGYALLLGKEQEPYKSYWKAQEAGEDPIPFFVGLKIEGGVYDGQQLVLAWPDTYELPTALPEIGGAGGNEGNAGSDDRDDSTQEGQRPGLSRESGNGIIPGLSEKQDDGLSGAEPSEEPVSESVSGSETRIPDNKMPADIMSGTGKELNGQRQVTDSAQYEAAGRDAAEADEERKKEMPDGSHGIKAAAENAMPSPGSAWEGMRTDRKEQPDRRVGDRSSRMILLIIAGAAAILTGIYIAAKRSMAVRKMIDTLRGLFTR